MCILYMIIVNIMKVLQEPDAYLCNAIVMVNNRLFRFPVEFRSIRKKNVICRVKP